MKIKNYFVLLVLLCFHGLVFSQSIDLPIDEALYKPLKSNYDQKLKKELRDAIMEDTRMRQLVKNKKLSIGVVDLSNPRSPRFAEINGDHMMYAASLPKIAVLLAVQHSLEDGTITMNAELEELMNRMIAYSDNNCTTELIDLVGFEKIAAVLQDDRYNLYDEEKGGGLWVGKRYGKGGQRNPDPIKGLSHAATATQVCRFYYMLVYGQLINCDRSEEMLEILKDPQLHHKFVNVLDQVCPEAEVYRKSGTWRTYHSDSVLVIGDEWRSYILVALVDDPMGGKIIQDIIVKVEDILKPQ